MPGLRHDLQEDTCLCTSSQKGEPVVARDRAVVPETWSQRNRERERNQVLMVLFELLVAALTLDFSLREPMAFLFGSSLSEQGFLSPAVDQPG